MDGIRTSQGPQDEDTNDLWISKGNNFSPWSDDDVIEENISGKIAHAKELPSASRWW